MAGRSGLPLLCCRSSGLLLTSTAPQPPHPDGVQRSSVRRRGNVGTSADAPAAPNWVNPQPVIWVKI